MTFRATGAAEPGKERTQGARARGTTVAPVAPGPAGQEVGHPFREEPGRWLRRRRQRPRPTRNGCEQQHSEPASGWRRRERAHPRLQKAATGSSRADSFRLPEHRRRPPRQEASHPHSDRALGRWRWTRLEPASPCRRRRRSPGPDAKGGAKEPHPPRWKEKEPEAGPRLPKTPEIPRAGF